MLKKLVLASPTPISLEYKTALTGEKEFSADCLFVKSALTQIVIKYVNIIKYFRITFTMKTVLYFVAIILLVSARPQGQQEEPPRPYDFNYKVENPPTNTYFGQNENGDQQGRVIGTYYVWLADGRLMTVEYYVDGQSGFVPKISYQANANPVQG